MCPICNYEELQPFGKWYVRCPKCKTLVVRKMPPVRQIRELIERQSDQIIREQRNALVSRDYRERLNRLRQHIKSGSKIMDFGCGSGLFLKYVISKGFMGYGFDKSKGLTKNLQRLGIPSYANVTKIPNGYFDAVTCFDVIEHTTNPCELIKDIRRTLKKNGVLMVTTPNAYGVSGCLLKSRWWVFGPEAHYIMFSIDSLKKLLTKEGFEIVQTSTDTLTPWFIPIDNISHQMLNKIIYLCVLPFTHYLFQHNFGDNSEIIGRKK